MKFEVTKNTFNHDKPDRMYFVLRATNGRYDARFFHFGDDYWDLRAQAAAGTPEDQKHFLEQHILGDMTTKKGPIDLDYMGGRVVIKPSFYGYPFIYPNEALEMSEHLKLAAEDAEDLQALVDEYLGF